MTNTDQRPCPACDGTGVKTVGDAYETETFDCTACGATGVAGGPVFERPCGCRTEEGVFLPCADHQTSDLGTPYEEADR